MPDGERLEILLFKQPQQQVARFAGSTCPATPGRAHRLHGTCTLDPGRASGELRSQKTCPLGRDVYSGPWTSFRGSYGVKRRARRDDSVDPLGFTRMPGVSIPHIRQQLLHPWTSLYNGRVPAPSDGALRALGEPAAPPDEPRGSQMCQLDSQGVPAWVYVGVSILHLHAHQQQQRTDPWTSFNYRRAASAARCGAWIARVYRRGGASIAGRASIACLPSLAGSAFIAGRASIACLPSLAGSSFIAGRARSAAGRDLLAWALGDESHLVQTSSVTGSGLEGEPCYGRGIRELGRSKSASSTHVQICE